MLIENIITDKFVLVLKYFVNVVGQTNPWINNGENCMLCFVLIAMNIQV